VDVSLKPFFRRKYLLTKSERAFYKILREAVRPHSVVPKVRIADLIEADKRHHLWLPNFRRISPRHVDFVVCDAALSPIIAVELDDPSHELPRRQNRDRDVDRIFELANMPIAHFPVQKEYCASEIERQLLAKLPKT
jgi:Protein of unknown function (DUF2726)